MQKTVPCTGLSSAKDVRDPSSQPSKTTIAVNNSVINVPKNNLCLTIVIITSALKSRFYIFELVFIRYGLVQIVPKRRFLDAQASIAFSTEFFLKSGQSVFVTQNSLYEICQSRKLLILISLAVRIKRSGSARLLAYIFRLMHFSLMSLSQQKCKTG